MAALPLPYYIRVWIFYECEEPEISARKEILDNLGQNTLHWCGASCQDMTLLHLW